MNTKVKGDMAEAAVISDLLKRGYQVAKPVGEGWEYDLILRRGKLFERIEVKYAESDSKTITVRARSHSVTAGRVSKTKIYTAEDIEWLAVFDKTSDKCYYVPASKLAGAEISLRIVPAQKNYSRIRWAKDYLEI